MEIFRQSMMRPSFLFPFLIIKSLDHAGLFEPIGNDKSLENT